LRRAVFPYLQVVDGLGATHAEVIRLRLEKCSLKATSQWQATLASSAARPSKAHSRQVEMTDRRWRRWNNMRERAQMAGRSQDKAYQVISKRAQENLAELQSMLQPHRNTSGSQPS
jgi:hypothetical protein